jgi:hypothetical protein
MISKGVYLNMLQKAATVVYFIARSKAERCMCGSMASISCEGNTATHNISYNVECIICTGMNKKTCNMDSSVGSHLDSSYKVRSKASNNVGSIERSLVNAAICGHQRLSREQAI